MWHHCGMQPSQIMAVEGQQTDHQNPQTNQEFRSDCHALFRQFPGNCWKTVLQFHKCMKKQEVLIILELKPSPLIIQPFIFSFSIHCQLWSYMVNCCLPDSGLAIRLEASPHSEYLLAPWIGWPRGNVKSMH